MNVNLKTKKHATLRKALRFNNLKAKAESRNWESGGPRAGPEVRGRPGATEGMEPRITRTTRIRKMFQRKDGRISLATSEGNGQGKKKKRHLPADADGRRWRIPLFHICVNLRGSAGNSDFGCGWPRWAFLRLFHWIPSRGRPGVFFDPGLDKS